MKKNDYVILDLKKDMDDLKNKLDKEYQVYAKMMSPGYEWSGEDFAKLYHSNLELLNIIKKQDEMIKNIYEILDRHESGLG